jgi:phage terminase Nu1 subunit (DNA packaging protein)
MGSDTGGLDLVQERAALAREQRIGQAMKNAVARGEFAPVGLLADVLAAASAGVVDRFEQLDGALRKACPDLPEAAREVVQKVIASARNEWIKSTETLAADTLDALAADDEEEASIDLRAALDEGGP